MTTLKQIALPPGWDTATLTRLTLRDGSSYASLAAEIDTALNLLNEKLTQSYFGQLVSLTSNPALAYRSGVSSGYESATEFGTPDGQRAETSGHMLPLKVHDRKLGWTYLYLLNAARYQLEADMAGLLHDTQALWEQAILTRLFQQEAESGATNGLGAAGLSLPFCDGGASGAEFVPPPMPNRGGTFADDHNHYLRLDGITPANLNTATRHLWEHGHDGPFELIVSLSDLDDWTDSSAMPGYVERADPLIQYGSSTALAQVADTYLGGLATAYGFCRLVASGRLPSGYWGLTRSHGALHPRNPLRVRYDTAFGFGAKLVGRGGQFPLEEAIGMLMFGVGVGADRTAAVLVRNAESGSYSTPAIG